MLLFAMTACTPGNGEVSRNYRVYKVSNYDSDDSLTSYDIYSYDSNNRLETDEYYNSSDELQLSFGFTYDSSDRFSVASVYDSSSTLLAYGQCSYNGNGLLETFMFYYLGYPYFYNVYSYDTDGFRLGGVTYTALNVLMSSWTMEYNANGLVEKVTFYDASNNMTSYKIFDYDADGKMVTTWVYDSSDTLTTRSDLSYDSGGKLIKISTYEYSDDIAELKSYSTIEYESGSGNYNLTAQSGSLNDFYSVVSSILKK